MMEKRDSETIQKFLSFSDARNEDFSASKTPSEASAPSRNLREWLGATGDVMSLAPVRSF